MALPANVGLGSVIGHIIDTDGQPVTTGTVELTPSTSLLRNITSSPPMLITPKKITMQVNNTGDVSASNVIATDDADLNPVGWNYKVSFKIPGVTIADFNINVPQGTVVDLALAAPVGAANGVLITRGVGVPEGGTTGQVIVKTDTGTAWSDAPSSGIPAGSTLDSIADSATRKAMTATERTKLGSIASGATVNSTDAQLRDRATHTGTQTADTITDGTTNKAYTATEKTKLAGVATGATANSTDAQLRDRSTHTGTQAQSTITNLTTDLAAKITNASSQTVRFRGYGTLSDRDALTGKQTGDYFDVVQ